jgi:biopolymer transport protein ExbD
MIGSTIFYARKKPPAVAKLSLVSMMDIFTILLFFLLLNSGESQKIENAKFVNLPDSVSGLSPHNELLIFIDDTKVWLGDIEVATVADVLAAPGKPITGLKQALDEHKAKKAEIEITDYEKHNGLPVTILGSRSVSYELLKTVMATCQGSDFREISLAVNRIAYSNSQLKIKAENGNTVTLNSTSAGGD